MAVIGPSFQDRSHSDTPAKANPIAAIGFPFVDLSFDSAAAEASFPSAQGENSNLLQRAITDMGFFGGHNPPV